MNIGFDLDNTIANYDIAIEKLASSFLETKRVFSSKNEVKSWCNKNNKNDQWTLLQGFLYGPGMRFVKPYQNAVDQIARLKRNGNKLFIISHKTKTPYAGKKYRLREYAKKWILGNIKNQNYPLFNEEDIFFESSIETKIKRITDKNLDAFVDDLPIILGHKKFPKKTKQILFNPGKRSVIGNFHQIFSWLDLERVL